MQLSAIGKYLEAKTRLPIFRWFLNIFLILIIYVNAQIGYKLGEYGYPLAISAVWPATGIALAALLMLGFWTWPGIFLGNLLYNFLHLVLGPSSLASAAAVAMCISIGSLLQALLAAYWIQKFIQKDSLSRIRDVVIFLLLGGLIPCLIACTVGVVALFIDGILSRETLFQTWLTFWIGDTVGVYVFTPLIIVWSIFKPRVLLKKYRVEAIFMALGFLLVALLVYSTQNYPLVHLILPLLFWATYRFRMHGATLSTFIFMLVLVVPTALGRGSYIIAFDNPLLWIISYVGVVAALTLLLGALLNEYDEALVPYEDSFTGMSQQELNIAVPINVTSIRLSLTQNPNIQLDDENMIISARQEGQTILVQIQLPK